MKWVGSDGIVYMNEGDSMYRHHNATIEFWIVATVKV